jgi:uncharacterized repeat protein (TIGR02543 family)
MSTGHLILPADYASFAYSTGATEQRSDRIFAYRASGGGALGRIELVQNSSPDIYSTKDAAPVALKLNGGVEGPVFTYNVTFDPNGGAVTLPVVSRAPDAAIGILPTPTRTGYDFDGWYTAPTSGVKISEATKVTGDITYYAHWEENSSIVPVVNYTVTFNPNGGSVSPASIIKTSGASIDVLPTPTRPGYTFDGWYTSVSGGTKISESTLVTGNITYYAHWKAVTPPPGVETPPAQFTVTFDANGGTVSPVTRKVANGAKVGSLPTPSRTGYIFVGWYTAKSGGSKAGADTLVTENITYYAYWTEKTYILSLDANGGSILDGGMAYKRVHRLVRFGERYHLRNISTSRSGYTFTGWYTLALGGTKVFDKTGTVAENVDGIIKSGKWVKAGDLILYAHWQAVASPSKVETPVAQFTVTFNANGGTVSLAARKVANGAKIGSLPAPSRTGYKFAGWFTARSGGAKVSANTVVKTNVAYYAHWQTRSYKATFNANKGKVSGKKKLVRSVKYKSKLGKLPSPKRKGYKFKGWYTKKSGGKKIKASTKMPAGNVTYYARWKKR